MPDAKPADRAIEIVLLTLVAGSADALGYLSLGKVFTSNMTGNVVLLGIAVSEGRGFDTGRSLFAFLAFIVGNCVGAWLWSFLALKRDPRVAITTVLAVEALLLLAYAATSALHAPDRQPTFMYPLITLLAISMGLQAAALNRLGTPGITTTAITGTLTTLFGGLVKTYGPGELHRSEPPGAAPSYELQALVILLYGVGAAISGVLNLHAKAWAGFFPVALVALTLVIRLNRRMAAQSRA